VELLEELPQIAKPKPADVDELRPSERFELVHEAHDRLLC
jgi:hypothetical protein